MRRLVFALLALGCGAQSGSPVRNVGRERVEGQKPRKNTWRSHEARPAIDVSWLVPDFHEELRWPLSGMNHPVLEPRFAVAQVLAVPGIEWQELCARGVQNRTNAAQQEMHEYLGGWCAVLRRDIDGACRHLTPLLTSYTHGLAPAVRQDLANILAAEGDADRAEHWLSRYDIRDIETLDLLAANFVEVGSAQDAVAINRRVMDSDVRPSDATQCRRLVKHIVLAESESLPALQTLHELATKPKVPDPVCAQLQAKVACFRAPTSDCAQYLAHEHIDARASFLLASYFTWPGDGDQLAWWHTAATAQRALPLPGAAELALTAYEASLRADPICRDERAFSVWGAINTIRASNLAADYEPRVRKLADACSEPLLPSAGGTAAMPTSAPR